VIDDPTFGLSAGSFFGGGVACVVPHRSAIIIR
jgi:hypothetical protein